MRKYESEGKCAKLTPSTENAEGNIIKRKSSKSYKNIIGSIWDFCILSSQQESIWHQICVLENLYRERGNSLAETYPKSLGRMLTHVDLTTQWVIKLVMTTKDCIKY